MGMSVWATLRIWAVAVVLQYFVFWILLHLLLFSLRWIRAKRRIQVSPVLTRSVDEVAVLASERAAKYFDARERVRRDASSRTKAYLDFDRRASIAENSRSTVKWSSLQTRTSMAAGLTHH